MRNYETYSSTRTALVEQLRVNHNAMMSTSYSVDRAMKRRHRISLQALELSIDESDVQYLFDEQEIVKLNQLITEGIGKVEPNLNNLYLSSTSIKFTMIANMARGGQSRETFKVSDDEKSKIIISEKQIDSAVEMFVNQYKFHNDFISTASLT